jgi:hypothetical protein
MDDVVPRRISTPVRWLVSDGAISLDGFFYPPLAIQAGLWILLLAGATVAMRLSGDGEPRRLRLAVTLAVATLLIAICGYLTPFSWWPAVGYCQTNGDGQFAFRLNDLFALPWLLATMGLAAAVCSRVSLPCPRCTDGAIAFRKILLRPGFAGHSCPACGTKCRLRHPYLQFAIAVAMTVILLVAGSLAGGQAGFVSAGTLAVFAGAWCDYRLARGLGGLVPEDEGRPDKSAGQA